MSMVSTIKAGNQMFKRPVRNKGAVPEAFCVDRGVEHADVFITEECAEDDERHMIREYQL